MDRTNGFLDRLDAMVINTVSPMRAVKVRLNRNDGITVEWGSQGLRNLSAEQLSSEITRAVVAALQGAEQGVKKTRETLHGTEPRKRKPNPEKAERRKLLRRRIEELEVSGSAAQGFVTVNWQGRTNVDVHVAAGALTRLTAEALREAVNQALATARSQHNKTVATFFVDAYRLDRLGQKWKEPT
ncbi:MAG: hypothetical protein ACRD0P_07375 [Stackebrandtia sp.]